MDFIINKTIKNTVPTIKQKDNVSTYITPNIINLQKFKSHILTQLHRKQRVWLNINEAEVRILKDLLKDINSRLKIKFANSVNTYWKEKIQNIPTNDSASMFPQVNQLFKKKSIAEISSLKIPQEKKEMLEKHNITYPDNTDEDGNIIICNLEDKLNAMGASLADINNNRPIENPRFSKLISDRVKTFLEAVKEKQKNNETLCYFNENNQADNPTMNHPMNYFTNAASLEKKFRKLNNKKLSGLDEIPNVVLKHLPRIMIRDYAILFNNLLNHKNFPLHWKKAKVVTIQKKDKESSNPLNYRPISLLPNISKVYEMIINDAILAVCTK